MPMVQGKDMASLEGFSRMASLIAAWLSGGRSAKIRLINGRALDLTELLRNGLIAGTDPKSSEYWGAIGDYQLSIVEAADIALALWLTRDIIWVNMTPAQKTNVATWLFQVNQKRVSDNNWHLFVVQTNIVLAALNAKYDQNSLVTHYARAKSFYVGNGWFKDGYNDQHATFDYYNAWAFQYHLQWISQINPAFDASFIQKILREFITNYQYLICPEGFPILGPIACYRMAAPAPLIFGQAVFPGIIKPDEARSALNSTWQYFIRQGDVAGGNILQGYCGKDARILESYSGQDARILESYSGQASCLWSLRSLVAAFYLNNDTPFWLAKPLSLRVERQDYNVKIKSIDWKIIGNKIMVLF